MVHLFVAEKASQSQIGILERKVNQYKHGCWMRLHNGSQVDPVHVFRVVGSREVVVMNKRTLDHEDGMLSRQVGIAFKYTMRRVAEKAQEWFLYWFGNGNSLLS